jgi:hypothetical protein
LKGINFAAFSIFPFLQKNSIFFLEFYETRVKWEFERIRKAKTEPYFSLSFPKLASFSGGAPLTQFNKVCWTQNTYLAINTDEEFAFF